MRIANSTSRTPWALALLTLALLGTVAWSSSGLLAQEADGDAKPAEKEDADAKSTDADESAAEDADAGGEAADDKASGDAAESAESSSDEPTAETANLVFIC